LNAGIFDVIAEECEVSANSLENVLPTEKNVIRLIDVGSGWGNGAHPTTKLCMDFIMRAIQKGDKLLDYGTGSGILSIAAAKLGASHCIAVDIDEDTLIAAEMNGKINGVSDILDVVHTRSVYVGEDRFPISDVTVANILPVRIHRMFL
jgi:ribosomal protein L11 methyltransferase